jgi:hypothetical protein
MASTQNHVTRMEQSEDEVTTEEYNSSCSLDVESLHDDDENNNMINPDDVTTDSEDGPSKSSSSSVEASRGFLENFNTTKFVEYDIKKKINNLEFGDQNPVVYRISQGNFLKKCKTFIADRSCLIVNAIIFGPWDDDGGTEDPPTNLVRALELLSQKHKLLPNLRGIFIGDIPNVRRGEVRLTNISSLLSNIKELKHLKIVGSISLVIQPIFHNGLRSITIETSAMSTELLRDICKSRLANLERLELWLGAFCSGATWAIDDLVRKLFLSKKKKSLLKKKNLCFHPSDHLQIVLTFLCFIILDFVTLTKRMKLLDGLLAPLV